MSNLSNQQINSSFSGLLQVPGGVTSTLQTVQDGNGNSTGLQISTNGIGGSTSNNFIPSVNAVSVPNAISRPISDGFGDFISVKDFGAIGNGVADDTTAIQNAINAAVSGYANAIYFPFGNYLITSTINIKGSTTVQKRLTLFGAGNQDSAPTITGSFDGYLIDCSGTSALFNEPCAFVGLHLINTNNGSGIGSAGCIKAEYTGRVLIENCYLRFQNTGLKMYYTICPEIRNTFFVGDDKTNPNITYSRGIYGGSSTLKMYGGRVYSCYICFDITGDTYLFSGVNCEFSTIIFRQQGMTSLLVDACHFETSGMLWTNATTLPNTTTSPWTDTAGPNDGSQWIAGVTFNNCVIYFTTLGTAAGVGAPLFVQKNYGNLTLTNNVFDLSGSQALATISQSFNYSTATSIPAGTNLVSLNNNGFNDPATIPDAYSLYFRNDTGDGSNLAVKMSRASIINYFNPTTNNTVTCGDGTHQWSNVYATKYTIGNGPQWLSGTGTPLAVVSAPVGSFYSRTDGGASTSFYVKESGTGATGWVAK